MKTDMCSSNVLFTVPGTLGHSKLGLRSHGGEPWRMEVAVDPRGKWELNLAVVELLNVRSPALRSWDLLHTDDLD